jgi:RND superfamily putative drug exporter
MITGAALILAVVAGAFMFTDNELMKALGLGLTASVLIDVTVVRILLVPSLMKLLGKANWWLPGFLSSLAKPKPKVDENS